MKKVITLLSVSMLCFATVFAIVNKTGNEDLVPESKTEKPVEEVKSPLVEESSAALSKISFNDVSHDFGAVKMGETAKYTFKFINTGEKPLLLENVKPSCGCTSTNYTKEAIPVGGEGFVEAIYPAKKIGIFKKTITVTSNTDPKNKILSIRGEVVN